MDQKQQLVDLCQTMTYKQAAEHAREKLGLQLSVGTLSNLCTTWQIAEDNDTREHLEAAHNATIETLTEKQLQLRLLELASRPNMDHAELRAITQSFARLQSVKLSARRVQLAEAKEARLAPNAEPGRDFSVEETEEGIQVMLRKPLHEDPANESYDNHNRRNRREEILTNSDAPEPEPLDEVHPTASSAANQLPPTQASQRAPSPRGEGQGEGPQNAKEVTAPIPNHPKP